jgi:hypothetical protein
MTQVNLAVEARLLVLLEAADPYKRLVPGVSKAAFRLSRFWSRASLIKARSASLQPTRGLMELIALTAHFFF